MNKFYEIIGEDAVQLSPSQMAIRAALVFLIALLLIRFSGRRAFGQRSPFDNVITILLGAILSRSVVKSDVSFFAPIAAAAVIAMLHRVFSWISFYSDLFGRIVKGDEKILFKDGKRNEKNMRHTFITEKDLLEGIRREGNVEDESKIKEAWVERDGGISVIKKEE
jgi:uncharacterized membrane protein YcaP (DUF421 family)